MRALLIGLLLTLALPAAALGADPGRWSDRGHTQVPLTYWQGVTSDPDRRLWFNGIVVGLYRTDDALRERARTDNVIPADVSTGEGHNHVGDPTWDDREGGRVLLPLECYTPGQPNGGNTCGVGSIGVADPATLRFRYYVKLDPGEIQKAMWAEVSPDGTLLWTSAGADLLAYRTADITLARAAPAATPIRAVRRLAGAVPPPGITGAAFYGDRLYLAGEDGDLKQVWSVDVTTGARRLEIERVAIGESEGLDVIDLRGGLLHWLIAPADPAGRPATFGNAGSALLHFAPRERRAALRIRVRPAAVRAGRSARVTVTATRGSGRAARPVAGAIVRLGDERARTSARGVARLTVRLRAGRRRVTAERADLRRATATLLVRR